MVYNNKLTFKQWCDHMGYNPKGNMFKQRVAQYETYLFDSSCDKYPNNLELPAEFDTTEPHLASWMQE